jgi:predicted 3-demethylubiquinone-9 3-methyltransferase (glyoxalase superfamily)
MASVSTMLLFDGQAEEAAKLYTSVVKNSKIIDVIPYGDAGPGPKGSVMLVTFELDGQRFIGLNAGPQFTFSEATAVHLTCDSQAEIDELWDRLTADGGKPGPCGWLTDKYGLSWNIDSRAMHEMIASDDHAAVGRVMKAMMGMSKLDIHSLRDAYDGKS